jgi:hypothetical protein
VVVTAIVHLIAQVQALLDGILNDEALAHVISALSHSEQGGLVVLDARLAAGARALHDRLQQVRDRSVATLVPPQQQVFCVMLSQVPWKDEPLLPITCEALTADAITRLFEVRKGTGAVTASQCRSVTLCDYPRKDEPMRVSDK